MVVNFVTATIKFRGNDLLNIWQKKVNMMKNKCTPVHKVLAKISEKQLWDGFLQCMIKILI